MMVSPTITDAVLAGVVTVGATVVAQALYRFYKHRMFYSDKPGPPHSFLWGHLKIMGEIAAKLPPNMHPQAYYTELARIYNLEGMFYMDLWPIGPRSVIVTSPELSEEITASQRPDQHSMSEEFLAAIVGPNVIATVNGPVWKKLHNAMAPAFSWSHIRSVTDLMLEECQQFRTILNEKAESGVAFSMEDAGAKLIFDVIARIVFNFPLHAQTTGSSYIDDLRTMIELGDNQTDPTIALNPIRRVDAAVKKYFIRKRLDPSIKAKIQERLDLLRSQNMVPSRKEPNSILDLMLREYIQASQEGQPIFNERGELPKSETDILLSNIKGLLVGGHGTTNDTLCFTYSMLSKFPKVLEKLRQEHSTVFANGDDETFQKLSETPELLQDLPYTEAVIKETLRLFPVGFGMREAKPGATLTLNGRALPIDNGQAICLSHHDLHYNEKYFERPAEFLPERWLDPANEIPRSYFRTFSRGHRACQGQNLAMNELKVILIATVREYDFECVGLKPNPKPKTLYTNLDLIFGDAIFQELGLEAKPRGPVMMRVTRRER